MAKKRTIVPCYGKTAQRFEDLADKAMRKGNRKEAKTFRDAAEQAVENRMARSLSYNRRRSGGTQPLSKFHPQHPNTNNRGRFLNEIYNNRQKFA